jgi:lipoic acid synthetase
VKARPGERFRDVDGIVRRGGLHTVCREALCPNRAECWEEGTATFMILGDVCTRGCGFCGVRGGTPKPPDEDEPARLAAAVARLGLRHAVLTSVTRDDLPDGGAAAWAAAIGELRRACPGCAVEALVPDFGGDPAAQDRVIGARPDVFGHNLETVRRLYPVARRQAGYERSLGLLARAAAAGLVVKTGAMAGLGETDGELAQLMDDARAAGASFFTLGQYLRPTRRALPVARYLAPEAFVRFEQEGLARGFTGAACGPFVRSSFRAAAMADAARMETGGGGHG